MTKIALGALGLGVLRGRSAVRAISSGSFCSSFLLRGLLGSPSHCAFLPDNGTELGFVWSFHSASTPKGLGLRFTRPFSDSPNEDSKDSRISAASPSIKPVSYPMKPKDASASSSAEEALVSPSLPPRRPRTAGSRQQAAAMEPDARAWTREDVRYVKDAPVIAPVSYPTRVAPLPEDRVAVEEAKEEGKQESKVEMREETGEDRDGQKAEFEKETRRIERQVRVRRVSRVVEENLPFPILIKPEKGKTKVVMDLQDAIREVKAHAKRKFTETVEAHVSLGVDARRGDQMVRGAITLPHGTGKIVRVAVFAEGSAADEARAAGADIVGGDELIEEIRKGGGKLNFGKCIAVPSFMPRLGKIARILGPRGLMPNPKLGSLTNDVTAAVQEAKRGRIDFKIDKTAIVHVGLGKVNFPNESLLQNVGAFVNALLLAKPVGLKKTSKYAGYVNSFTLCSTMGPGFPVSIQSLSMAADHYNKLKLHLSCAATTLDVCVGSSLTPFEKDFKRGNSSANLCNLASKRAGKEAECKWRSRMKELQALRIFHLQKGRRNMCQFLELTGTTVCQLRRRNKSLNLVWKVAHSSCSYGVASNGAQNQGMNMKCWAIFIGSDRIVRLGLSLCFNQFIARLG